MSSIKHCLLIFILLSWITTLNGQNWLALGDGFNRSVRCIYNDTISGFIYVGGEFSEASDSIARGIAFWDGTHWNPLSLGIDDYNSPNFPNHVQTIIRYDSEIFVGGAFSQAGTNFSKYIAKWNGINWDSLPDRFNGPINKFRIIDNNLYICGTFDSVGNIACGGLIKWDGNQFSAVGNLVNFDTTQGGTQNNIADVIKYNNHIYIAGNFYGTGGLNSIAYLDSGMWKPLQNGVNGFNSFVFCMTEFNNELYISGLFTKQEGNAGNYIQKWNGTSWSEPGNGVQGASGGNGQIDEIKVIDNRLFAVGKFSTAGGIPAKYIASFNGGNWCGLGSELDISISTIESHNSTFLIGGGFRTIDLDTVNYISRWNGGLHTDTCSDLIGFPTVDNPHCIFYPNPFEKYFTIEIQTSQLKISSIVITNGIGNTFVNIPFLPNQDKYFVSSISWPAGMYFVELLSEEGRIVKKVIKK